jgi:hypothetical protein
MRSETPLVLNFGPVMSTGIWVLRSNSLTGLRLLRSAFTNIQWLGACPREQPNEEFGITSSSAEKGKAEAFDEALGQE